MGRSVCLATPVAILVGSGIASLVPQVADSLNNSGAHGFSELLYAYLQQVVIMVQLLLVLQQIHHLLT